MRWGLLACVVVLGCRGPGVQDAGVDAGFCRPLPEYSGDGGPSVEFLMRLCGSPEAPLFVEGLAVRVFAADGGEVSTSPECMGSCARCDGGSVCDSFFGVAEVTSVVTLALSWDGRTPGRTSTCPAGQGCRYWEPVAPGAYTARFCVSRTAARDRSGRPVQLGPLECVERTLSVPFEASSVSVTFSE